jgi:hypothetical protein
MDENCVVSLYVVKTGEDTYFGGFNADEQRASFVSTPLAAKKFTNKYDIKLRPEEMLVELQVDLSASPVVVSEPFRPHRRRK